LQLDWSTQLRLHVGLLTILRASIGDFTSRAIEDSIVL